MLQCQYLGFQVIHVIQVCFNIICWSLILGYALLQLTIHVSSNVSCYFSSHCSSYSQHLPWKQTQPSCFPRTRSTRATGEWDFLDQQWRRESLPSLSSLTQKLPPSYLQTNQGYTCHFESTPRDVEQPTCVTKWLTAKNRTENPCASSTVIGCFWQTHSYIESTALQTPNLLVQSQ